MNHIYLMRLVILKNPGFHSQKYGMPIHRLVICTPAYYIFAVTKTLHWKCYSHFNELVPSRNG